MLVKNRRQFSLIKNVQTCVPAPVLPLQAQISCWHSSNMMCMFLVAPPLEQMAASQRRKWSQEQGGVTKARTEESVEETRRGSNFEWWRKTVKHWKTPQLSIF